MATNTGDGYRKGQVRDRYQVRNENTKKYDKYDSNGNYVGSKKSEGKYKGIEERAARKHSR